jgi:hypothetical protein
MKYPNRHMTNPNKGVVKLQLGTILSGTKKDYLTLLRTTRRITTAVNDTINSESPLPLFGLM